MNEYLEFVTCVGELVILHIYLSYKVY
jgi:hypothetical protein